MTDLIKSFIQHSPFAAVLWQLRSTKNDKDIYMLSYNKIANDLDRRNFELFLDQPYRLVFSEALELRNACFQAIESQKRIVFDEFEHNALRSEPEYFRIWIIPLDNLHVMVMYENITAKRKLDAI